MTDGNGQQGSLPQTGAAYEAARLRWATLKDADRLVHLFAAARPTEPEARPAMLGWLEQGGALLLEDSKGTPLCALRWREEGDGWRVDRIATLPDERGQGYGRWLMTKVEALAIRYNVPELKLTLDQEELLPYYRRLGYRVVDAGDDDRSGVRLSKRVGGTWQVQASTRT